MNILVLLIAVIILLSYLWLIGSIISLKDDIRTMKFDITAGHDYTRKVEDQLAARSYVCTACGGYTHNPQRVTTHKPWGNTVELYCKTHSKGYTDVFWDENGTRYFYHEMEVDIDGVPKKKSK
jgi:hypothetical protein